MVGAKAGTSKLVAKKASIGDKTLPKRTRSTAIEKAVETEDIAPKKQKLRGTKRVNEDLVHLENSRKVILKQIEIDEAQNE